MKKYIEIVADTNDADYVTSRVLVTDKILEKIKPVIEAIKNFKPYEVEYESYGGRKSKTRHDHNYPNGECCREDMGEKTTQDLYGYLDGFEVFDEMVPYGEYGIHTIISITLIVVAEETNLLKT